MRILSRTLEKNSPIRFRNLFKRIHLRKIPADTVELSSGSVTPVFKHIKLKTAERLYNTNFTYSDKEYGNNVFKAFVLSKKTGEPVEVLILPKKMSKLDEQYYIVDPNNLLKDVISVRVNVQSGMVIPVSVEDNLGMTVIGERSFSYSPQLKEITTGTMSSKGNTVYSGLGLIEHQIAIERMLMKNCNEITIYSIPSAYKFHKNCGFETIREKIYLNPRDFQSRVEEYSRRLDLDENTVRNMMVYRKTLSGDYILDENSSFEKFINYMSDKNAPLGRLSYFSVNMRLSAGALKEWKKIIRKNPILINKMVPEAVS